MKVNAFTFGAAPEPKRSGKLIFQKYIKSREILQYEKLKILMAEW